MAMAEVVQIDYDVVYLRNSLVQLFVLVQLNFEEVVQIIKLRRFRGAANGYPFTALMAEPVSCGHSCQITDYDLSSPHLTKYRLFYLRRVND
jgi:hypothetical protein